MTARITCGASWARISRRDGEIQGPSEQSGIAEQAKRLPIER